MVDRRADFKTSVQDFESSYAYRDQLQKAWLTWEVRYSAAVERADSKKAFGAVLAVALSELHDFHAEVRSHVPNRWLPVPTFADIWAEREGPDTVVTAVREGSDAERAGVRVGDRIVAIGAPDLKKAIADRLSYTSAQADANARQ